MNWIGAGGKAPSARPRQRAAINVSRWLLYIAPPRGQQSRRFGNGRKRKRCPSQSRRVCEMPLSCLLYYEVLLAFLLRNMRACLSSLTELDAAQMEERAFQGRQVSRGLVFRPPNRETAAGQGRAKKNRTRRL